MDTAADIPVFFADFGVDALVGGVSKRVIFDNNYAEQFGMAASGPRIVGASADLDAAEIGVVVVVNGKNYTVAGPAEPDGTGMTTLRLQEA